MTDKQFNRAKEIKSNIADLEKLKGVNVSYAADNGSKVFDDLFNNPIYIDFQKIEKRLTSNWERLIDTKILALQKEFAKL